MAKKTPPKMSPLHKKIVAAIMKIPRGKVATYGQIARLAGRPGAARQVVWTLHSSSRKYKLPWHRVINSKGGIGIQNDRGALRQRTLLRLEGVQFNEYNKVDLKEFQWDR